MSSSVSYGKLRPAFVGTLGVVFGELYRRAKADEFPCALRRVGELIEFADSGVWGDEPVDPRSDFKVFRVADFRGDFELNLHSAPLRSIPTRKQSKYRLQKGDILVVKSSGSAKQVVSGRVAVFDANGDQPYAASNFLLRLRPSAEVDSHYFAFALGSPEVREKIADSVKTMTYPNLPFKLYRDLSVPIIPIVDQRQVASFLQAFRNRKELPALPSYLTEQRRIVSRIEELAAKVEEARALRREATSEATALIDSQLAAVFESLRDKYDLEPLGSLLKEAGYGTSRKCDNVRITDAVPVLRIPNVASECVNLNGLKYAVLEGSELKRVEASPGDILIVRTNGSADLVGRCAVVPDLPEPTAFASYLVRLRCDNERVNSRYVQLMLKHLRTNGNLIDFARTTAGQYNVSLGRLRAARLPVPPPDEQKEVISNVEAFQLKAAALQQKQSETAAELDALMPSILAKAFRGEL